MMHTRGSMSLVARGWQAALAVTVGAALALATVTPAGAAGATTNTKHTKALNFWGTPIGTPTGTTNCLPAVLNDFVHGVLTGNGVAHTTTNGAGDFWATTTFAGTGTLTFYPRSSLTVTVNTTGTIVGTPVVTGPSDMAVTGHLTEWFGVSANKQSAVIHGTINFTGTIVGSGTPISLHSLFHAAWLPGNSPTTGPPNYFFSTTTC